MSTSIRYAVISPVRNEEQHLGMTIQSMLSQTLKPAQWIIVNDGSSDRTRAIAEETARLVPWIQVVNRPDRGFRKAGGGVIDAFYDGYESVDPGGWDYLVKLDGDLKFAPDYFQQCIEQFERDSKLGIAGGTICNERGGVMEPEFKGDPAFHVRGATKIYRQACWQQLGGLLRAPGWDTLDEVKANMLGWTTRTIPEIKLAQLRPTGAAYGTWNDRVKGGLANYITGYHPLFMLMKCIKRMAQRPYFVGGIALWVGFIKGYLARVPQVQDKVLINYLRQQQLNRLMARKSLWS